jgi:hypothetical protein
MRRSFVQKGATTPKDSPGNERCHLSVSINPGKGMSVLQKFGSKDPGYRKRFLMAVSLRFLRALDEGLGVIDQINHSK